MKKYKIIICVGTRPNFIKITKLKKLFHAYEHITCKILHTGQHYDSAMSTVFFDQLGIGAPDFIFPAKSGTQMEVIAAIIKETDELFRAEKPDLVMVPGDVNSSLACALSASRNNIAVAHIESGLRSFDRTMPEEINRILIDDLSDLMFVTEPSGMENLKKENKPMEKVHFVGNTMIDSIAHLLPELNKNEMYKDFGVEKSDFGVATFHRPSNVDQPETLKIVLDILHELSQYQKVLFPIHPRTKQNIEKFGFQINNENIVLLPPLDYINFLGLISKAKWVVTDSGGIQEETTYLGVPCITVRENTERPVTAEQGTNTLSSSHPKEVSQYIQAINHGSYKKGTVPDLWDGKASERMVKVVVGYLEGR